MNKIKLIITLGVSVFYGSIVEDNSSSGFDPYPPSLKLPNLSFSLLDIFDESDWMKDGSTFFWADYQLISNRGDRPELMDEIIPMVALNYEKRLLHNLSLRASVSTHWWNENKALVITGEQKFTEVFEYRYWSGGLGAAWHFSLPSNFDPYIGGMGSYRLVSATCKCSNETSSNFSFDFFVGTRFFFGEAFFLNAELGNQGTGYLKLGLGFRFN